MGNTETEEKISARRRMVDAFRGVVLMLQQAGEHLEQHWAGELLPEDWRQAQNVLIEITGAFPSVDLLGKIFRSFCIGK